MRNKDYCGKCGSCKYCDLSTGYTSCYTTTFKCTRANYSVKADEERCSKYEIAQGRTNELIAIYDK